jgi:hypothetical protein
LIDQPTGTEPVNDTCFTRASVTGRAASSLGATTTFSAPLAVPASSSTSASSSALSGVFGDGLTTIVLPDASAGATLWATRFSGKLKGVMP